jgi:uncharacterized protein
MDTDPAHWLAAEPSAIIMQPTTFCNLDCAYCYLPDRRRKRDMSTAVATAVASAIPDTWSARAELEIVWHGGEPLAAGHRRLVELLEVFEPLRREGRIKHVVQTNATLITDDWCEVFGTFEVSVGVSLDGPRPANGNRLDLRGRPAFDRISSGIDVLRRHGIDFSAIAVVSADSVCGAAEILDYLEALDCRLVGFNMEEKEGANHRGGTPSMELSRSFWRDVFTWTETHPTMPVREVQRMFDFLALDPVGRATDVAHDTIPSVAYNGDVVLLSPELVGIRDERYGDFVAGSVLVDSLPTIIDRAMELDYVREFTRGVQRCKATCEYFAFCQGSHAGNRYFEHGTFTATETQHCRNSTQAVVLALHDVSYPKGVAA